MKKFIIIVPVFLFSLNSFSQGYRCEGYCGGIDVRFTGFFDGGYLVTEYPGEPELGYSALMKKCQNRMPQGVQARIYRHLEVTKVQTTITIKVDSLLSTESCHFDSNIQVPTYDGVLLVQG